LYGVFDDAGNTQTVRMPLVSYKVDAIAGAEISVSGKGYFSVNAWFRKELAKIGLPVRTGNIKKLIVELKRQLP